MLLTQTAILNIANRKLDRFLSVLCAARSPCWSQNAIMMRVNERLVQVENHNFTLYNT